jgi:hypothetical protein
VRRVAPTTELEQKGLMMARFHKYVIAAPGQGLDANERASECRAALRTSFETLALAAQGVGWDADETALALLRLAGAHVNERVTSSAALALVRSRQRAYLVERRGRPAVE